MSRDNNGILPEREERGNISLQEVISVLQTQDTTATCPDHGAYKASVMKVGDKSIVSYCPRCTVVDRDRELEQAAQERRRSAAEARQNQLQERIATANIPLRFRACGFHNFNVDDDSPHRAQQIAALKICRSFARNWSDSRARGTAIVMTGSTGTGKTHLACAVGNSVMADHQATVAFGTVTEHTRAVKSAFQKDSEVSEQAALRALIEPDLLIIDEVGMRSTEYDQQVLFDVINSRYAQMRPLVLMTNLTLEELKVLLGDRLADRLQEIGVFINFAWPSYRARVR